MQYPVIANNMAYRFLFGLLLAVAMLPAHAKMYRWVDSQGKVHYTDALPPSAAAQGNTELSKTGNVVNKTESAEERAKRLAAEAEAAERKKVAEEQKRRDRALLATYTTEREIDLARDRVLEHHNLMIKSAQTRLEKLEPNVNELEKRIRLAKKGGKPAPPHLQQQYDAKKAELDEINNTIKTNQSAMLDVRDRYEAEKVRFRELTVKP